MYPTHAAVLHISARDDEAASDHDVMGLARSVVEAWCKEQLREPDRSAPELLMSGREPFLRQVALRNDGSVVGEIREVDVSSPDEWAWQARLERPLLPVDNCEWDRRLRTDIQMRLEALGTLEVGRAIVITIREQLAFPDGMRPSDRSSESAPPCSLLSALLEQFTVSQGNIEWTRSYWQVRNIDQVEDLHRKIVDRKRTVPLVVCVGDESQGPPVEPAMLARDLFGTARVVHISNPRLTARLRVLIGETHRVGWNVIRLYRPGFSITDSAGMHRFFRRAEIERYADGGFAEWFSRHIRREESFLVEPDSVVRDRIRARERAQSDRAQRLIGTLVEDLKSKMGDVAHDSLHDAINLVLEELDTARVRMVEAETLASSYADELESAKEDAFRLKARVSNLEQRLSDVTQPTLSDEAFAAVPATVAEAVQQVMTTVEHGELEFHDRVLKQVNGHRSKLDPVQVRDMLIMIRDVARQCRGGHGDRRGPADYFRERGVTLKSDISETAKQHYESDYALEVERQGGLKRVLMGPHVNLTQRHRIYWHHDKDAQCFVIGHIGDHLRDATTN